jgi:hypothetical protein
MIVSRSRLATTTLVALAAIALSATVSAETPDRPEYERTFSKTVPLQGEKRLEIEHSMGALHVRTHKLPEVRIEARIQVSSSDESGGRQFGEAIAIEVEDTPTAVRVRTKYPEKNWTFRGSGHVSYSVDYEILMPETAPLSARDKFGDVSVEGLKAAGEIVNANGRVSFRDGRGTQKIENAFGAIELARNAGDVGISGSNGTVTVTDVDGSLDVRNRFGDVTVGKVRGKTAISCSNGAVAVADVTGSASIAGSFGKVSVRGVSGSLEVENSNGGVEVNKVGGALRVRSSFGKVDATGIGGDAVIDNSNSGVTLADVTGSAQVHTSFGAVRVTNVAKGTRITAENGAVTVADLGGTVYVRTTFGMVDASKLEGELTVENSNGAVKASDVKGGASVRTSFAPVTLDGIGGKVDVENQNGSVDVRAVRAAAGKCFPLSVRSSFGAIRVYLPDGAGFRVDAKTSFGKINSEMPLTLAGGMSGDEVTGVIGDGKCPLTVANSNGSIDLLKGK